LFSRLRKEREMIFVWLAWGILFLAFFLSGCVQKVVIPVEPDKRTPPAEETGHTLFHKAENLFESGSYPESLAVFESFVKRFPRESDADTALMRIGTIRKMLGDSDAARLAYEKLIQTYPESRFVSEARVEVLESDYQKGKYDRVIREAPALLLKDLPDSMQKRLFTLLGDTYLASGVFFDAVRYYLMGFHAATIGPDRDKILSRMEEAIGQMDNDAIRILMRRTDDPVLKSRLVVAFVINAEDSENPEEAIDALKDFLDRYPRHDPDGKARALLEKLTSTVAFDRHAIGCLLPLSGAYQTYGKKALRGIEMALADFSAALGHQQVKLIVKDTRSDPESAKAGVRELVKAEVAAIIGPIAEAESAAAEAQKLKIPIITLTQKENIPKSGDYVFRNFMTPRMQVETLVGFCANKLGLTRFAVLYPEESYGDTLMNLFWDAVIAHGGTMVGVESYSADQTDFSDPIKKLVGLYYHVPDEIERTAVSDWELKPQADVETGEMQGEAGTVHAAPMARLRKKGAPYIDFQALFIPDAPDKAGLILPQLTYNEIREVYLLGTNLWHSQKLLDMAQKYAQDAMMTDGFNVHSISEPTKSFVERFAAVYGEKPGFMEAVAYDTARIILEAAMKPYIRFRSHLKDEILRLSVFQGLTGPTSFDSGGEVKKTLFLFRVKEGRFVEFQ